jgi:hypothetical protein
MPANKNSLNPETKTIQQPKTDKINKLYPKNLV